MTREPDLDALRALVTVAEEGGISAAGRRLGISQQAVSVRLRALERELGVRLLVRTAQGSRVSAAGEVVLGWASTLLAAADEYTAAVTVLRTEARPTLRIAASLTVAEHLLPDWLAHRHAELGPGAPAVHVTAANSAAVIRALHEGQADLGFIETTSVPADLSSRTMSHDRIDVVAPQGHPWAQRRTVSPAELARTALVLRESGSGTRQTLEEALAAAGHPRSAEPAAVITTTLGIRSAVMSGVAPGALSGRAVAADVEAGRLVRVRVRGLEVRRPLTAVWPAGPATRDVREFLAVVERTEALRTPRTPPGPDRPDARPDAPAP